MYGYSVITKNGLLYYDLEDGDVLIMVPYADMVARQMGILHAEQLVKHLDCHQKRKKTLAPKNPTRKEQ